MTIFKELAKIEMETAPESNMTPGNTCRSFPEATSCQPPLDLSALKFSTPQPQAIKVPQVIDLEMLSNCFDKNQVITDWYDQIDRALSLYMGGEEFPAWARFAKHASFNAGKQLANLQEAQEAIAGIYQVSKTLKSIMKGNLLAFKDLPFASLNALRQIYHLFLRDDLVRTSLVVALSELNLPDKSFKRLLALTQAGRSSNTITVKMAFIAFRHFRDILDVLPNMEQELKDLAKAISESNQAIYQFMAPRLSNFLEAYNTGQDYFKKTDSDPSAEFLTQALFYYQNVHMLSGKINASIKKPKDLIQLRSELLVKANVLATFGKQQNRVQPRFSKVTKVLKLVSKLMEFESPIGCRRLLTGCDDLANWGDLYTRMGLDPSTGPENWTEISLYNFPKLLAFNDPLFQGTIGELLVTGSQRQEKALGLLAHPASIARPIS